MRKLLKMITLLVWLTVSLVLILPQSPITMMPKTAVAAPSIMQYTSNPTNHTFSPPGGVKTGLEATRAYDNSNATYATWAYTRSATYGGQNGYVEFNVYGPSSGPPRGSTITRVDLKAYYYIVLQASTDATLQLTFAVGSSSETILVQAARWAGSKYYNVVNASVAKPGGGSWAWEDISNLKYRFKRNDPNLVDTGGNMQIFEVWATVYYESAQTVAISPKAQYPIPSIIKINVTAIEELYGFEFVMTYNTTAIDVTSIQLGPYLNTTAGGTANTFGARIKLDNTAGIAWATQTIRGNFRGGNIASGTWETLATINIATHGSGGPTNLDFDIKLAGLNYLIKKAYPASFTLVQPGHDVAVTSVVAAPTSVTRGDNVNVDVTVQNQGDYVETFFLLTYANTTAGTTLIQNRTVTNLARGTSQVVPVTWNTRDFGKGNYTVSATAATRGVLDADSADNTKYGTLVEVNPRFGDINEDGWVDGADIVAMNAAWGTQPGNPLWSIAADLNLDSKIDAKDLRLLGRAWQAPP